MWLSCRRIESRFASVSEAVFVTSSPSTVTVPASIDISRATMESSVDFPAPFGPMMEVTPPAGMETETPSITTVSP
ncbi:hypothetical protein D3C71_724940 [compost metagenome]